MSASVEIPLGVRNRDSRPASLDGDPIRPKSIAGSILSCRSNGVEGATVADPAKYRPNLGGGRGRDGESTARAAVANRKDR